MIELHPEHGFRSELIALLNKFSKENGSDTPDYILADYLISCLDNFNISVNARRNWYGQAIPPNEKPSKLF